MIAITDYKVNKSIDENILNKNGFRYGTYKKFIYKDIIQFVVHIDLETHDWDYQVYDINHNSYYMAYYNRQYGKNEVVDIIDKKMNEIITELEKNKILIKNGDD